MAKWFLQSWFFSRQNFFCSEKFPFSKIPKKKVLAGKKINLAKKVGSNFMDSRYGFVQEISPKKFFLWNNQIVGYRLKGVPIESSIYKIWFQETQSIWKWIPSSIRSLHHSTISMSTFQINSDNINLKTLQTKFIIVVSNMAVKFENFHWKIEVSRKILFSILQIITNDGKSFQIKFSFEMYSSQQNYDYFLLQLQFSVIQLNFLFKF